jgi:hypothetical protein
MRLRRLWSRPQHAEATPSPLDAHDERLRSIRRIHVTPDDEGHTREDKERERKYNEADRQPPFFG